MRGLEIQPVLRRLAEGATKTPRPLGRHRSFTAKHMRYAHRRDIDRPGECRLAHPEVEQDLLQELAWVDGRKPVPCRQDTHGLVPSPSVIVDDLDIERVAGLESEAQPPLVVDPDAPLANPVARQCLEPVGQWFAQVFDAGRRIQLPQPHGCTSPDRSEEHTSELPSLMRNSYAVFC